MFSFVLSFCTVSKVNWSSLVSKMTKPVYNLSYTRVLSNMAERVGFEPTEPCGSTDFECCTFDHSDNSPCLFSSGFLSRNLLKNSLERKQERRQKIFDFEIFCVEEYQGESGGRNSQLLPKFRVFYATVTGMSVLGPFL